MLHHLHPFGLHWFGWLQYFACFLQRILQWWPHFVVVEEGVHMAPQRLRWAPQKWWGYGCTTPPCLHWYTTVVIWRCRNFSEWWDIILLCTSFLGHRRSFSYNSFLLLFFSSPAQEVLPLTDLLPLKKSLNLQIRKGQIHLGHLEASSLIFT